MKLVTAVSAMALLSVGAANAAVASYDFESADVGAISVPSFGSALTPLGITSSVITGNSASPESVTGVWLNGGNQPNATFGNKSFTIGYNGTWTLTFGGLGISSLSLDYFETETAGFIATVYGLNGTTILGQQTINGGAGALGLGNFSFSGVGSIGKFTITDLWAADGLHDGGDNVQLDNLSVNTLVEGETQQTGVVPEPSTYLMIGSALAGLAAFRSRRS